MFPLTRDEVDSWRSHFATSNVRRGGRRSLPHAFTEHGILMLASVLRSEQAVQVKIAAMDCDYDTQFKAVFDAIRQLMKPGPTPARRIGFKSGD